MLTVGKRQIERPTGYHVGQRQQPNTRVTDVFWRLDGKQVAFYVDTNPSHADSERWTYVWDFAAELDASKAPAK